MISRIVNFSVARRWHVFIATILLSIVGAFALTRLPIDAVPDITNTQVQINVVVPSLSPADVERQVTYPIETAFAGIPGLETTRSLTRHGFAQVTTVFKDGTDIYFARQLPSACRPPPAPVFGPGFAANSTVHMYTSPRPVAIGPRLALAPAGRRTAAM